MSTNQRENARKEKKIKKSQRNKRIIWAVIIVVMSILLGLKLVEIDYSKLGQNIKDKFTQSVQQDTNQTFNLDSPNGVVMTSVNDKLNVLTESSYTVYDTNNKSTNYTFIHGYSNPYMKCAGNYTCLYDQGGYRIRLDTNNASEYESKLDNKILCADVANNGTIIYATMGESTKSKITVVNKALKKILEYDVSQGYVTRVAVDSSGKKYSFVAVNTKDANLVSTLYTINIGDDKPIAEFEFMSSNVLDINYEGSSLFVVCDNSVSVVKNQKKLETVFAQDSVVTVNYSYTKDNQLIYAYADFSESIENKIARISSNGNMKSEFSVDGRVKCLYPSSNEISVLFNDKICVYSMSDGELKNTIECNESVNSIVKMSSKMYVQRQQIIESFDC